MRIVKVDIHGTRGLALRDAKGSRVTVARIRVSARCWLRYTGAHGHEAIVTRRVGRWQVSLWNGLRYTQRPQFALLRSALAVARQHVGLAVAPCYRCGIDEATPAWLTAPVRCACCNVVTCYDCACSDLDDPERIICQRCRYEAIAKPQEIVATVEYR